MDAFVGSEKPKRFYVDDIERELREKRRELYHGIIAMFIVFLCITAVFVVPCTIASQLLSNYFPIMWRWLNYTISSACGFISIYVVSWMIAWIADRA